MFLRIFSPFALLMLAACGTESPLPLGDTVDCAIGAGVDFSSVCTLEQVAGMSDIVIHHPDGGFRRFRRDFATGGVFALDGAEPLVMQPSNSGSLQFSVGADRYNIPPKLLFSAPQ